MCVCPGGNRSALCIIMDKLGVGTGSRYQGVATDWFGWMDGWFKCRLSGNQPYFYQ